MLLSTYTLKNIQMKEFEDFFRKHSVPRWSVRTSMSGSYKYQQINDLIKEETSSSTGSFSSETLDEFLWDQLFYAQNNYQYMYQFDDISEEMKMNTAEVFLNKIPELNFNKMISDWENKIDEKICLVSTRMDIGVNGKPTALHMLLRVDTINLRFDKTFVFCSVTLYIKEGVVVYKFARSQHDEIREPLELIKNISNTLKGLGSEGKKFVPLSLNVIQLNHDTVISMIYKLFSDLSKEAEDILNNRMTEETEEKITKFLESLELNEIKGDYIEQIKAVIFQDISSTMEDELFEKGWVFQFQFREGDHTKASSRQEKRLPVYSSKSFWQLKELIHNEKELYEAGFHWHINEVTGDEDFVDIRLEAKNGTMILNYYYNTRSNRKEKENFVIQKVSSYLQPN